MTTFLTFFQGMIAGILVTVIAFLIEEGKHGK